MYFNDTGTTKIYAYADTLTLHVALPICARGSCRRRESDGPDPRRCRDLGCYRKGGVALAGRGLLSRTRSQGRSEEHTSELQSLMRTSYAVFCLKKKNFLNSIN